MSSTHRQICHSASPARRIPSVLVGIVLAAAPAGAEELARYDGSLGGVPQDSLCWEFVTNGALAAPINEAGAVLLGPTTNSGTHRWEQSLVPFSFDDGASISAEVKVTTSSYYQGSPWKRSGYYIALTDRFGRFAQLGISADRVLLSTADQNFSDQTFLFNSTGAFHHYSLSFAGGIAQVRIDGALVLSDTVGVTGGSTSVAQFGDLSILTNSKTHTALVIVEGIPDCSAGDLDCSGFVDGADLGILLSAWDTNACAADLDHNGFVDGADLGLLLANWGEVGGAGGR